MQWSIFKSIHVTDPHVNSKYDSNLDECKVYI